MLGKRLDAIEDVLAFTAAILVGRHEVLRIRFRSISEQVLACGTARVRRKLGRWAPGVHGGRYPRVLRRSATFRP